MINRNTLFSPLEKHVSRFTHDDHQFDAASVGAGLDKIHGSQTGVKGRGARLCCYGSLG